MISADLIVGLFLCLAVLFGVGWGPALTLLRAVPRRLALSLAISPALGLALLALFGLPLVMYAGPATHWALRATLVLLTLSAALILWERRRDPRLFAELRFVTVLKWAGVFAIGCLILWMPVAALGPQYATFRSNPGDSFTYMSLAETLRRVPWDTIQAGRAFSAENLDNIARLAAESPTALYSARFLGRGFPLNHPAALAWLSELAGVASFRFYAPFHIILRLVMLPVVVALGIQVGLRRWLLALTALAVAAGFWARLVIEADASAELGAAPLLALAVFGWTLIAHSRAAGQQTDPTPAAARWRWRILVAISWAALAVVYRPMGAVVAMALLLHLSYDAFILRKGRGWLTTYAPTALLALLFLLLTGQFGYHLPAFLDPLGRAEAERQFDAAAFDVLTTDKLGALASLPTNYLLRGASAIITLPSTLVTQVLGLAFAALWTFGLLRCLRDRAQGRQRAIFFVALAGIMMFLLFWLDDNAKAAGKAFTYIYTFCFLGVLIGAEALAGRLHRRWRQVFLGALAIWLLTAVVVGALIPFDQRAAGRFARSRTLRADYALDLQPITTVLDRSDPDLVLVDVPRDERFFFAFYVMLALSNYPTYFQSGLVIDGGTSYQNLWLGSLDRAPDYAVILKTADYLDSAEFAQKVAETPNLRLYHITADETDFFHEKESKLRMEEQTKAVFPSLAP